MLIGFLVSLLVLIGCEPPPPAPQPAPSPQVTAPPPALEECCAKAWPGTHDGQVHEGVKLTGYYPDGSAMEGGFHNRYGEPLQSLQDFARGKSARVSVAMDKGLGKVRRKLCSPELNAAYGRTFPLLVEDTGSAFTGKVWTRADICTGSKADSLSSHVNGKVRLIECN